MRVWQRLYRVTLNDDIRSAIPMGVATAVTLTLAMTVTEPGDVDRGGFVLVIACIAFTVAFLIYLLWTHLLFTRMPRTQALALARWQFLQRLPLWVRPFSFGSAEGSAIFAALTAFIGSLSASVYGVSEGGVGLTVAALAMAATAWAMVAYTYGLRYFRIYASERSFVFEFTDEPSVSDFLAFALTVSSAGTYALAAPQTRTGARALRSHTVIAFVFNALVIAVTVSLITNLVATVGA